MGEDIVDAIDRVLSTQRPGTADSDVNALNLHMDCPRNILQYAKEEILRLRAIAGPVTATPTASEIYHGLRHPSPAADAEGA